MIAITASCSRSRPTTPGSAVCIMLLTIWDAVCTALSSTPAVQTTAPLVKDFCVVQQLSLLNKQMHFKT